MDQLESGFTIDGEDEDQSTVDVTGVCINDHVLAEALQAEEDDQF